MWFTPCSSKISSVASASACETEPSAAAPKIVRVLSWPVLPNGAVAITVLPYLLSRAPEGARVWPPRSLARVTDVLRVRGADPALTSDLTIVNAWPSRRSPDEALASACRRCARRSRCAPDVCLARIQRRDIGARGAGDEALRRPVRADRRHDPFLPPGGSEWAAHRPARRVHRAGLGVARGRAASGQAAPSLRTGSAAVRLFATPRAVHNRPLGSPRAGFRRALSARKADARGPFPRSRRRGLDRRKRTAAHFADRAARR